jgi:hypothetical protein
MTHRTAVGVNSEGWLPITAWAARTERIRIGPLVGANPFREPTKESIVRFATEVRPRLGNVDA